MFPERWAFPYARFLLSPSLAFQFCYGKARGLDERQHQLLSDHTATVLTPG
jgi:hypothetical protein